MNYLWKGTKLVKAVLLAAVLFTAPALHAGLEIEPETPQAALSIPDSLGRAGMAAAVVSDADEERVVLAAGGANFPHPEVANPALEAERKSGEKVYYNTIYKLRDGRWTKIGALPKPLAYAAFGGMSAGMVIAGGENADGPVSDVWMVMAERCKEGKVVTPEASIVSLPSLPLAVSNPAFVLKNGVLYVIGGQTGLQSSSPRTFSLKLTDFLEGRIAASEAASKLAWAELPPLPAEKGRMLAAAAANGSTIYVMGGCELENGARRYCRDVFLYDIREGAWLSAADHGIEPMPVTLAAPAVPAPVRENEILLIGGDDGSYAAREVEAKAKGEFESLSVHPGQSNRVYLLDSISGKWSQETHAWPVGVATSAAVVLGDRVMTVSGETSRGIRTPVVASARTGYMFEMSLVDWCCIALLLAFVVILGVQMARHGVKSVGTLVNSGSRVSRYAWVVVGLLWVVAMLNYFDRQLLTTIREPIVRDIPQTDMQFGMLTAAFLLIYSVLSPIGGFLADKYSRRVVILCSLVVWSAVTWITGHVTDYTTLFIARACMGISEACYIPAALALITDYHRGRTRSLATGIHMSGIYTGMAIAGLGGSMGEMMGWRMTFALFGLVGIAYAFVLIVFLRDPKQEAEELAQEGDSVIETIEPEQKCNVWKYLLSMRAVWMLMGVVAVAGIANWFLLAWLPTLMNERFPEVATVHSTLWTSVAKFASVLGAAVLADWWFTKNTRARAFVPGIFFCLSCPFMILIPFIPSAMAGAVVIFLFCVSTQGLAQGALDATLMPVLRGHIGGRVAATGYGLLNFVSAGFGAFFIVYGGRLKDMGISLSSTLAYSGVLMLVGGLLLLCLPKPKHADQ